MKVLSCQHPGLFRALSIILSSCPHSTQLTSLAQSEKSVAYAYLSFTRGWRRALREQTMIKSASEPQVFSLVNWKWRRTTWFRKKNTSGSFIWQWFRFSKEEVEPNMVICKICCHTITNHCKTLGMSVTTYAR